MNEPSQTETGTMKRARVSKRLTAKNIPKPRTPRTVDPGIEAINLKWKQGWKREKAELRSSRASGKILATIIEKRLPKLTPGDKEKLLDHLELKESVTPALALPHPDGGMPLDNGTRDA